MAITAITTSESKKNWMPYRVGGLLYTPAVYTGIAEKLERGEYPCLTSLALCLEDSIQDAALEYAEQNVKQILDDLRSKNCTEKLDFPLLFLRIRTPKHMKHMHEFLMDSEEILTGYILPKFDCNNAESYIKLIESFNQNRAKKLYIMPVLESRMIAESRSLREKCLDSLKNSLNSVQQFVLNIRVGGNDLSNFYGLRRDNDHTIYEIGVIREILEDIISVFSSTYVVSGPVWEYFGKSKTEPWAIGLERELKMDLLNGFIGKTAIHPSQLPLIYENLKVSRSDYEDATRILNWSSNLLAVQGSQDGNRMNEVKCHKKWAKRVKILGQIYGIREDSNGI